MAAIFKQALGLRGPDAGRYVQHFFVLFFVLLHIVQLVPPALIDPAQYL